MLNGPTVNCLLLFVHIDDLVSNCGLLFILVGVGVGRSGHFVVWKCELA